MSRSPRRRGAKPAVARQAPGKQVNRSDEITGVLASVGKASLVAFLAVPALAIVLIAGSSSGAEVRAELSAQVLGSVLAAMVTGLMACCERGKSHG
ncbi:hypothetical protein ACFWPQ_46035 [Streptomyces sp. NPDC058464]|uniref:hypothetical protein n=1 Tax=Streptomyces sp. NPDC058464 TaxID=3346511 RepID=UPI00365E1A36